MADSAQRGVKYQAFNFCLKVQNVYRSFFGERQLPGRSLQGQADRE